MVDIYLCKSRKNFIVSLHLSLPILIPIANDTPYFGTFESFNIKSELLL
jgi:hypothetical protein